MFCAIYWPRLCNPQSKAYPPPHASSFPYLVLVIVGAATKESTTAAAGLEQKVPRLIASYFALFMVRTD